MQRKNLIASAALAVAAFGAIPGTAGAQEILTGDTRLACEAILCLATGTQPSECTPSLRRYFSISYRKLSDTIRGRVNFLNLCPVANQTPQMTALVNAQANGAGRCDAASLNAVLRSWTGSDDGMVYVSNQMPSYCTAYTTHATRTSRARCRAMWGFLSGEGIGSRRGTMTAPWPNTTPASRQKTKSAAAPVGAAVATKGT